MITLKGAALRYLKGRAQLLPPVLKVGKAGLTDAFYRALDLALDQHELVKIRFDEFKTERQRLIPEIATRTASQLVLRVGHVAVFYRQQPDPARRKFQLPETKTPDVPSSPDASTRA